MSNLDLVLVDLSELDDKRQPGGEFDVELQSSEKVVAGAEKLQKAWPAVMSQLMSIVQQTDAGTDTTTGVRFESIEFNIGIEAGIKFGITGTGSAGVTVTFKRRGQT